MCGAARRARRRLLFIGAFLGHQVFQARLELLDLAVDLLGLAPELHALEFGQLQLELLDFRATHAQCLLKREDGVAQLRHLAISPSRRRAAAAL